MVWSDRLWALGVRDWCPARAWHPEAPVEVHLESLVSPSPGRDTHWGEGQSSGTDDINVWKVLLTRVALLDGTCFFL